MDLTLIIIGYVRSTLTDPAKGPKMETEDGAVRARIELDPQYVEGLDGLEIGAELELFTWFHLSGREALSVHPRGDMSRPKRGVFTTRSPNRPNPIGLHRVTLVAFDGPTTLVVEPLEAVDGTPVVDIKKKP